MSNKDANYYVVSPAYGRDYKTRDQVVADWKSGNDFTHDSRMYYGGGTYISVRDTTDDDQVEIKYAKRMKETVIKGGKQ